MSVWVQRMAQLQLKLAMLALGVMGAVTCADVALKYAFHRPIRGAYDLVETLLPVVIFHGMPATLLRRQNIAIDLIDHIAGPRGKRALIGAGDVVMLAILGLMLWAMVSPAMQALDYGDRKIELGVPLFAIWVAAILGVVGSVIVVVSLLLGRRSA